MKRKTAISFTEPPLPLSPDQVNVGQRNKQPGNEIGGGLDAVNEAFEAVAHKPSLKKNPFERDYNDKHNCFIQLVLYCKTSLFVLKQKLSKNEFAFNFRISSLLTKFRIQIKLFPKAYNIDFASSTQKRYIMHDIMFS